MDFPTKSSMKRSQISFQAAVMVVPAFGLPAVRSVRWKAGSREAFTMGKNSINQTSYGSLNGYQTIVYIYTYIYIYINT